MEKKTEFVMLHQTVWQSWLCDLGSFAFVAAVIGLGWMLDSSAMQWLGAAVAFLTMYGRAAMKITRTDMAGARAFLDKIERGEG